MPFGLVEFSESLVIVGDRPTRITMTTPSRSKFAGYVRSTMQNTTSSYANL